MRVLASGFLPEDTADHERLRLARRTLGHDLLVLFTPDPDAPAVRDLVARDHATGGNVRLVAVDATDLRAALDVMARTLEELARPGDVVRAAVGGGSPSMACAALLACMSTATEAWFFDGGRATRLAVPRRHVVEERFDPDERAVLAALSVPRTADDAACAAGLKRAAAKRALVRLRARGLVVVGPDGRTVAVTSVGHETREHLETRARALPF